MQTFRIQILATGSELTSGDRRDSNAYWLAGELSALGAKVTGIHILPDEPELLLDHLQSLRTDPKADLLILTGGLGPTADDHSIDLLSKFTGLEIIQEEESLKKIQRLVQRRGLERLSSDIERQSRVLKGAHILKNPIGLAPGLLIKIPQIPFAIAALPGVPAEMRRMFLEECLPALQAEGFFQERWLFRQGLFLYGMSELELQAALFAKDSHEVLPQKNHGNSGMSHFQGQSCPHLVGITDWGLSSSDGYLKLFLEAESQVPIDKTTAFLRSRFSGQVFLQPIQEILHKFLLEKRLALALAESCTGGLLGKLITDLPGSSAYFSGGIVSYSNAVKMSVLGVKEETLKNQGAVSEACALDMAQGVLRRLDADVAVSITGIAGPSGGSAEKPVGTVYIGLASGDGRCKVQLEHFPPDRGRIRQSSAVRALYHLYRFLQFGQS